MAKKSNKEETLEKDSNGFIHLTGAVIRAASIEGFVDLPKNGDGQSQLAIITQSGNHFVQTYASDTEMGAAKTEILNLLSQE